MDGEGFCVFFVNASGGGCCLLVDERRRVAVIGVIAVVGGGFCCVCVDAFTCGGCSHVDGVVAVVGGGFFVCGGFDTFSGGGSYLLPLGLPDRRRSLGLATCFIDEYGLLRLLCIRLLRRTRSLVVVASGDGDCGPLLSLSLRISLSNQHTFVSTGGAAFVFDRGLLFFLLSGVLGVRCVRAFRRVRFHLRTRANTSLLQHKAFVRKYTHNGHTHTNTYLR